MRPLYLATKNLGKVREFEALLADTEYEVCTFDGYVDPVEGDDSYVDNAVLKSETLAAQLRAAGIAADVLADDSGLEVMALDGRPGVVTAYYGGDHLTWHERRIVVLDELAASGSADRSARFVCYLHVTAADGSARSSFGEVFGTIATEERGDLGFSFDPIFVYEPTGQTFAEMTDEEKNRVSHRANAARYIARHRLRPT